MSAFDSQRISTLPLSVHICLVATREVLIRTPTPSRRKGCSHEYVPRGACRSRTCAIRADTHLRSIAQTHAALPCSVARHPGSSKSAHDTSRITNRQTIGRDVFSHYTTRADNGVVSNENAGKDYHTRADPHVIFDDYLCRWRHHLT